MFTIRLMGRPTFIQDDRPLVCLNTPHFEVLLGGLLLQPGHKVSRDLVASWLWSCHDLTTRRRNLRQLLYRLRIAWPETDDWLDADRDDLKWRGGSGCWTDVGVIEHLIKGSPSAESIQELRGLVRGELMEGHDERWILPIRQKMTQALTRYFHQMAGWAAEIKDIQSTALCLEALVDLVPGDEASWRELARLHARLGNIPSLRATWEEYRSRFPSTERRQSTETDSLFEQLLRTPARRVSHEAPAALVGRDGEWDTLRRMWQSTLLGNAAHVTVRGGIGVGKTALVNQFQQWVAASGACTTNVVCLEGACMPYAALSTLLHALPLEDTSPHWRSELSRVLPKLRAQYPELAPPAPLVDPFQTLAFLRTIEEVLLQAQPLLLIVDDVQWADTESLTLLSRLLLENRTARIMVIVVLNTMTAASLDPVLRRHLVLLSRQTLGCDLSLAPIDQEQLCKLAMRMVRIPLSATELHAFCQQSEGNPLYLLAILCERNLINDAPLRSAAQFRQCIRAHLSGLSPDALDVLGALRLLKETFTLEELEGPGGHVQTLTSGLEELLALGLLVETADGHFGMSRWMREAIGEQLGFARRRRHGWMSSTPVMGHERRALTVSPSHTSLI